MYVLVIPYNSLLCTLKDTKPLGASWNRDLDPGFRSRVRTNIRQDENSLKFNLEIYDFSCGDKGLYSCEMTGDHSATSLTRLVLEGQYESSRSLVVPLIVHRIVQLQHFVGVICWKVL